MITCTGCMTTCVIRNMHRLYEYMCNYKHAYMCNYIYVTTCAIINMHRLYDYIRNLKYAYMCNHEYMTTCVIVNTFWAGQTCRTPTSSRTKTSASTCLALWISIAASRRRWPGVLLWDGLRMSIWGPGYLSRENGA